MADRPVLTLAPVTAPSLAHDPKQTESRAPAAQAQPDDLTKRSDETSSKAPRRPARPVARTAEKDVHQPAPPAAEAPWRNWGPFHQTVSFKWPTELATELDERRHDLREPIGLMVVAAIAHLLDQDDKTIRSLIDRAERAKPRSGRAHKRAT